MGHKTLFLTVLLGAIGCSAEAEKAEKPPMERPADGMVSRYGLPLIIWIDAPKPPPEIIRPSAPIPKKPDSH
jgi:hypothetical protein